MRKRILAFTLPMLTLAVPASAHFNLTMPPAVAQSAEGGKGPPPCGPDTSANGPITPATGGQPLNLKIDETTGHKGFYRFALALKAVSEFPKDALVRDSGGNVLPAMVGNQPNPTSSATADFETTPKFPIIADHMFVHANTIVQSFPSAAVPGQVILPNVNCDKCILQVDEFMAEHGSNGAAGYMYHHCAYLKITADPAKPIFDPNAASGGAGGASAGGASGASGAAGASNGGTGGAVTAGAAGFSFGGGVDQLGGAGGVPPASAGSAGLTAAGGAPATGGSAAVAGASTGTGGAGTVTGPASNDQSSGCSIGTRSSDARPVLAGLLGLLLLGRRRRQSRASS